VSTLKKKIRVNYEDVQINLVSPSNDNDDHCFGEYDSVKNTIQLDKTQSSRSLANSLLHEVLHSAVYHSGLNSEGNCLAADKDEELVVNNLSNTLSQIIRDNKWFLPYIQKNINSGVKTNEKAGIKTIRRAKKSVTKRTLSKNRNKRRTRNSRR
jgi:hypothetical protein|tara:strand:+ start:394 stop:855 length:462 start_codon:yes stop_codon:yes gene_type:complete